MARKRTVALAGVLAACAAVAGCGSSDTYKNRPRPPSPINVTASLSQKKIALSPDTFGAGPMTMIVSNQTSTPQIVTFESNELGASTPGIKARTAPIAPRATAQLQLDLKTGTYTVATRSGSPKPVSLKVGKERESAQNQLLQP